MILTWELETKIFERNSQKEKVASLLYLYEGTTKSSNIVSTYGGWYYLHDAEFWLTSENHEAIMPAARRWRLLGLAAKDKTKIRRIRTHVVIPLSRISNIDKCGNPKLFVDNACVTKWKKEWIVIYLEQMVQNALFGFW